ncbi:MAG TPA: hypothetical protein PLL11_10635, partial [Spirochaetota bacterium]|nr:hypothetical protein [Spirochaetota bacterium]
ENSKIEIKICGFCDRPYDYISVMHYGPEETTAIDSHGHPIGSDNISFTDALKVQDLYEKSE